MGARRLAWEPSSNTLFFGQAQTHGYLSKAAASLHGTGELSPTNTHSCTAFAASNLTTTTVDFHEQQQSGSKRKDPIHGHRRATNKGEINE